MTTNGDIERLYAEALAAQERVNETSRAYQEATANRRRALIALRDAGQSLYAMSKRLGISTSRLGQLVPSKGGDEQ